MHRAALVTFLPRSFIRSVFIARTAMPLRPQKTRHQRPQLRSLPPPSRNFSRLQLRAQVAGGCRHACGGHPHRPCDGRTSSSCCAARASCLETTACLWRTCGECTVYVWWMCGVGAAAPSRCPRTAIAPTCSCPRAPQSLPLVPGVLSALF